MAKLSAGLLIYRKKSNKIEVFLVHPGGPFWSKKDEGVWSIPKGEYEAGEDPLQAAVREFKEETGFDAPAGEKIELTRLKQPSGKIVNAWATEGNVESDKIISNTFKMEWPPKSGREQEFPEVDKAGWFEIETAKLKILKGQIGFLKELKKIIQDN